MNSRSSAKSLLLYVCVLGSLNVCEGQDPASALCTGLYSVNMRDTADVLKATDQFEEVKHLLQTANIHTYSDLQNMERSLGGSYSDLEDAIGLKASSRNDNSVFQQDLQTFLNSDYSHLQNKSYFESHTSQINAQLLAVIQNCQDKYFGSLRNRLSVEIIPGGYDDFNVKIESNFIPPQSLVITQILPSGRISCYYNSAPAQYPITEPRQQVLLECKKHAGDVVSNFQVQTSIDISPPFTLPAEPTPASPTAPPSDVVAEWVDSPPAVGGAVKSPQPFITAFPASQWGHCCCTSSVYEARAVRVINNCKGAVDLLAIKQTEFGAGGPFLRPTTPPSQGLKYSRVTVPANATAVFGIGDSYNGTVFTLSCPSLPVNVSGTFLIMPGAPDLPLRTSNPVCYSALTPAQNFVSVCQSPASAKIGDTCTCQNARPLPPTSSGYVVRLNCTRPGTSTALPCDYPQ